MLEPRSAKGKTTILSDHGISAGEIDAHFATLAHGRNQALGHVDDDPQLVQRDTGHHRLPGARDLSHLQMTLDDDTRVWSADLGVLQLLLSLIQPGDGALESSYRAFQIGGRLVHDGIGGQLLFVQALDPRVLVLVLTHLGGRGFQLRRRLGGARLVLGVLETRNHRVSLHEVVHVVKELLDLSLGLGRNGGAIRGLDDAVEPVFPRDWTVLDHRRIQKGILLSGRGECKQDQYQEK